jgi:hypothetical protein
MLRGADIRHLQAMLGHISIETTKRYLWMVPGHLREEYDKAMLMIALASPDLNGPCESARESESSEL